LGETVTVLPGQAVQAWSPVVFLKVPAAHAPHCVTPVLAYPTSHTHCALAVLAPGLSENAWHAVHNCGPKAGL